MGIFSKDIETMNDLFVHQLKDIYYEMTRYGTLIAWANALGRSDCGSVLKANLNEEEAADKKLTKIAEDGVNAAAA